MADGLGSDDELNVLFERVSIKLGWQSNHDANLDEVFEQLSQSTKKKKSKRNRASVKKKKSQTTSKKKTQDKHSNQSHPPPITSGQDDPSQSTSPTKADHEISRNLQLELQAESVSKSTCSSEVTPLYKDENDKYNEVLGDMTHLVSPKSTKDSPSSSPPGINDYKTQLELEGCSLHSELDSADEPLRGSGVGVQKSYKHLSDSWECENKEDVQRLDESQTSKERATRKGEGAVSSGRKLCASMEEGIRTFAGSKDEAEDDASEAPTKDFTESPQPMRWLMSPPAMTHESKLSPLHSDSQDDDSIEDSNKNADDFGDIFGENIPSLTERLTQSHRENKKSFQKNRRRSCANPRSAPVVLDNDWIDDDDDFDKEDEGKLGGEDNGDDGILDGETRLDVGKDGAEGSGASSKEEEDLHHDPLPQKNDGQALNTNAESFKKARSRHKDTSSSDDDFESFLKAVKTPQRPKQQSDSDEAVYVVDDDDFIDDTPLESKSDDDDDDEIFYHKINNLDNPLTSENKAARIKRPTVGSRSGSILSQLISSDDDDDDVFVIPNKTPVVRKPSSKVVTSTTSLKKTPARQRRPLQPTTLPTNRYPHTPSPTERTAPVSFLASLSTPGKGMSTRSRYVSDFKRNKDELTQKLFKLYNESIFESKLPSDFSITWNNRMRKTAGFCFYKKRLGDRTARIELSVKVCDSAERLRDTLVHELCHAAAWLIHGVSDGHGKFWKYWAAKANLAHPEIPVIKRCHTYEINTKYKYKCVECGNIIGRHSKSVDTKRFCCAYCNGRLELQPMLRKDGTPARARGPNPFAAFVKENYASVKKTHGAAKHAEVMKLLSQEFSTKTKITDT